MSYLAIDWKSTAFYAKPFGFCFIKPFDLSDGGKITCTATLNTKCTFAIDYHNVMASPEVDGLLRETLRVLFIKPFDLSDGEKTFIIDYHNVMALPEVDGL